MEKWRSERDHAILACLGEPGGMSPEEGGATLDVRVRGRSAPPAVIEDKTYVVTPPSVRVQSGILAGEITDMRVTERVEKSSRCVASPPRLTAALRLANTSETHSVRLVSGTIQYLDDQWPAIPGGDSRTDTRFTFTACGSERLDPGREAVQSVDVAFPAQALEAGKLKGLRLEIAYVSSPYRVEVISFAVSIGRP